MQSLEISCQNVNHNQKQIILFCLNKKCNIKRYACEECMKQFHSNHITDCFNLQGIQLILWNEYNILIKGQHDSNQNLVIQIQSLIDSIAQNLDDVKNILTRSDKLKGIVTSVVQCYNSTNYEELLSSFLFYTQNNQKAQQNIKSISLINEAYQMTEKELKIFLLLKKANELYEQREYSKAINFYQVYLKLGTLQNDDIIKLYTSLNLCFRFDEANQIFKNNLQIFNQYNEINDVIQRFYLEKFNYFNHRSIVFDQSDQDMTVYKSRVLMHLKQYNLSLQIVENFLLLNPNHIEGIKLKVEILLRLKQFGQVKEYIDSKQNLNQDQLHLIKCICIICDDEFFKEYKPVNFENLEIKNLYEIMKYINPQSKVLKEQISQSDNQTQLNGFSQKGLFNCNKDQLQAQYGEIIQIIYYCQQGQFDLAGQSIDKLLNFDRNSRMFNSLKSVCLLHQQNMSQALKYAKVAMYLGSPKDIYSRLYIITLIQNGKGKETLKIIDKFKDQNRYVNLEFRAKVLAYNQHFDEALECFYKMQVQKPDDQRLNLYINQIQNIKLYNGELLRENGSMYSQKYKQQNISNSNYLLKVTETKAIFQELNFDVSMSEIFYEFTITDYTAMAFCE